MYDLETLQLLATTETNQFRGSTNATKILWKVRTIELHIHHMSYLSKILLREETGFYLFPPVTYYTRGIRQKIRLIK
jgi:hypothetical protein